MSGLGDDLTFLAADITPSDWTDDESDQDAETIMQNWNKLGMYLPRFSDALKFPAMKSTEIELAEL